MRRGPAHGNRLTYCHGTYKAKIRYKTLKDAKRARAARSELTGVMLRVYRCTRCGGYHLTSAPARGKNAGRTAWKQAEDG